MSTGLRFPDQYRRAKIVGFDPGGMTTGVAVVEIDTRSGIILDAHASTINTGKAHAFVGLDTDSVSDRTVRLAKLYHEVSHVLLGNTPWAIGCEAPFYNPMMPSAYGSLTEVVTIIGQAALHYNPSVPFELASPLLVKKSIGVAGKKGKEVVREAISGLHEITGVLQTPVETLDEHAIDALAVAYCLIKYRLFC